VRFIVHPEVKPVLPKPCVGQGVPGRYDTSLLGWLRIDFGRNTGRQRRIDYKFHGVYGRCWYPTEKTTVHPPQLPGAGTVSMRDHHPKKPIYRNPMEPGRPSQTAVEARFTAMLRAGDMKRVTPKPR